MSVTNMAALAKSASQKLAACGEIDRVNALHAIATALRDSTESILAENKKDMDHARENGLNSALMDRLELTPERIEAMASGVSEIAQDRSVVGEIVEEHTREDGLKVQRQRIPIGVIAMVFESRPNVVVDCSALAIKSGNAIILKGGKEAHYSNVCLVEIIQKAVSGILPDGSVSVVSAREEVQELLNLNQYIDVVIPRGGEGLINYVYQNSKIPVIAHFNGLCHIYVHSDADLQGARDIVFNAKIQRPGVCNAMETLILNESISSEWIHSTLQSFVDQGVELFGDQRSREKCSLIQVSDQAFTTEWLDMKLSVKFVKDHTSAIEHVQTYGSNHTEAIIAKDQAVIDDFQRSVDASCVVVNASTRFNDGGQLGLGAELGISTTKLHAYGPMGAREMTTVRFVLTGDGQIRK